MSTDIGLPYDSMTKCVHYLLAVFSGVLVGPEMVFVYDNGLEVMALALTPWPWPWPWEYEALALALRSWPWPWPWP